MEADARARMVDMIGERKLTNVVVATGDVHKHHAGVIPVRDGDLDGPAAATEFVTSSISSGGDGADVPKGWEGVAADNPHTSLLNDRRGYQLFTILKENWQTDVAGVTKVSDRSGAKQKIASLVALPHRPGIHQA